MPTELHHTDPPAPPPDSLAAAQARANARVYELMREGVRINLARRLLESDIERRNATTLPTTHPNGLAK